MPSSMLRIAFAGTPDFAVPSLRALLASPHELTAVITQPDRPAGRGRRLTPPPVKVVAAEAGVPVIQPERLTRGELEAAAGPIDVLVVVAFGQILPADVLACPRLGAVNVHASLLPRWRGAAPIARALLAGDAETGVSIMRMTPGLDAGPVLATARTPIGPGDTAASLHDRLASLGADALVATLEDLPAQLESAQEQNAAAVTFAPKLSRAEARIDWSQPAAVLARAVRAFHPWPAAWTEFAGDALRIHRAEALPKPADQAPGTILAAGADGIDVATGDGILRLHEVQMAGRRALAAADFANARPLVGERLGGAA